MEASRIIRVGTSNFTIRIAAVSEDHVLVCITRKVTRPKNDTRYCFSAGIEVDLVVCVTVYRLPIRLLAKSALTLPVV